jgi:hypothetical protein
MLFVWILLFSAFWSPLLLPRPVPVQSACLMRRAPSSIWCMVGLLPPAPYSVCFTTCCSSRYAADVSPVMGVSALASPDDRDVFLRTFSRAVIDPLLVADDIEDCLARCPVPAPLFLRLVARMNWLSFLSCSLGFSARVVLFLGEWCSRCLANGVLGYAAVVVSSPVASSFCCRVLRLVIERSMYLRHDFVAGMVRLWQGKNHCTRFLVLCLMLISELSGLFPGWDQCLSGPQPVGVPSPPVDSVGGGRLPSFVWSELQPYVVDRSVCRGRACF